MVERLSVGPLGVNAYAIPTRDAGRCILVDPGDEAPGILAFLDRLGLRPDWIAATHGHLDHTAAIPALLEALAARGLRPSLAVPELDAAYFGAAGEATNRAVFADIGAVGFFRNYWRGMPEPDLLLQEGAALPGTGFRVLHTPGHTAGSSCFHDAALGILVSGDTLFRAGAGRTDGPDSDPEAMARSLSRLFALPPDTRVLPGHGEMTTIRLEAGR